MVLLTDQILTAGQTYHWGVRIQGKVTGLPVLEYKAGRFELPLPQTDIPTNNTFSGVTILTRGVEPGSGEHSQLIDRKIENIARHLLQEGSAVMSYDPDTGSWESWFGSPAPTYGKPLVLLADWMQGIAAEKLYNAGFAEAAADALFAALVQEDQRRGGGVGQGDRFYNEQGELIRTQGAIFNSPLHLIGFGQGAVVNSEIIQRLGTFFPNAGGTSKDKRDLQMTTIDPHDYDENSIGGNFRNILDPSVRVWNNVTYADNYYQTNGAGVLTELPSTGIWEQQILATGNSRINNQMARSIVGWEICIHKTMLILTQLQLGTRPPTL